MIDTLEDFINKTGATLSLTDFVLNLVLSAVLAILLSKIYVAYGNSLSNRKNFGRNFLLITMTTMLIITVVKSSLALSLGLVGALSIIRFRSAIKEPEELAYLFFAISIGLGFGANQTVLTVLSFVLISVIIIISKIFSRKSSKDQNLFLTIKSDNSKVTIDTVFEILRNNCDEVELRRFDETNDVLEVSCLVEARNFDQLNKSKKQLQELDNSVKITFLNNRGLV